MGSDDAEKSMTLRWEAVVLLVLVGTGCATSRVVRLDTGEGRPGVDLILSVGQSPENLVGREA